MFPGGNVLLTSGEYTYEYESIENGCKNYWNIVALGVGAAVGAAAGVITGILTTPYYHRRPHYRRYHRPYYRRHHYPRRRWHRY